jgi:hypothetical protein
MLGLGYQMNFRKISFKEVPRITGKVKVESYARVIPFKAATLKGMGGSLLVIRMNVSSWHYI